MPPVQRVDGGRYQSRRGAALPLLPLARLLLLVRLVLLLPGAQAGFPWPGSGGSQKQEDATKEHASAFASVAGGRIPKGVCLRSVKAAAVSTHAYPANNPIEDRHVLVDEQAREGQEDADGKRVPGMLHAAVLDGHGAWARWGGVQWWVGFPFLPSNASI